jgi:thymidylate synthase (FAD)
MRCLSIFDKGGEVMRVVLKYYFPLEAVVSAGLTCTANDTEEKKEQIDHTVFIKKLIEKGHTSVLEHLVYSFKIEGISRALLQQLARHRMASMSVESTRWALHKIANNFNALIQMIREVSTDEPEFRELVEDYVQKLILLYEKKKLNNDRLKVFFPELLQTNLVYTVNARSLRNLFYLRSAPDAFPEFRNLMKLIYMALPKTHRFIYEDVYQI